MDVRTLITELLEFDMDMEVEFAVGGDEISDFELTHAGYKRQYLHFKLDTNGEELIDTDVLQGLRDGFENLEDRVKELEEERDSLQNQIDEHE
jgi:hypothetical protein